MMNYGIKLSLKVILMVIGKLKMFLFLFCGVTRNALKNLFKHLKIAMLLFLLGIEIYLVIIILPSKKCAVIPVNSI